MIAESVTIGDIKEKRCRDEEFRCGDNVSCNGTRCHDDVTGCSDDVAGCSDDVTAILCCEADLILQVSF